MRLYRFWQPQQFPKCLKLIQLAVTYCIFLNLFICIRQEKGSICSLAFFYVQTQTNMLTLIKNSVWLYICKIYFCYFALCK